MSVLKMLSDGRFHSGQNLAEELAVSRTAVWKAIRQIRQEWGIVVNSVSGKGYRLETPLSLLSDEEIKKYLAVPDAGLCQDFEVLLSVGSTNRYLLDVLSSGNAGAGKIVVAEHQSAGRGRRGRDWVSPFGRNLYLSVLWQFDLHASKLGALSLAASVAVNRALKKLGVVDAQLKWPNDVHWQDRKLCGILLEMRGESSGPLNVVVGIGLNVNMANQLVSDIQQPWVDLQSIQQQLVDRNQVTAYLIEELLIAFAQYQKAGFSGFKKEWQLMDVAYSKSVNLHLPDQVIRGVARGVDNDGAFLLEVDGNVRSYHAGEVSLRLTEHG